MTPQQAVDAAATQAANISSLTATMTESISGASGETISGTVVEQLKPTLLLSMALDVTSGSSDESLGGIITSKAMYLHSSAFTQAAGKPWIEFPFSVLGGAKSGVGQFFASLSNINPARQVAVFEAARNVHDAGTASIDGVQTTHYTGSILPSAGLAALPPSLRKELAPGLKSVTGDLRFSIWVDSHHRILKLLDSETAQGKTITTTTVFSAINQPVHIALPRSGQVATIPAGALGSAAA